MNNKGFTLVELLGVLLILASVSLVAVGGISGSLERRERKECEEQKELAIGAAKLYFSFYNSNTGSSVTVGSLISGGYFSDNKKIDRLNSGDTINFTTSGYSYTGTSCG